MPPSPDHLLHVRHRVERLQAELREQLPAGRPVTLEIGSGHGHFLNGYAQAHPDRFCVGIDIIHDRWERSEKKRDRAALKNLLFFRAEAREFLQALPPETGLDDVFILFPDPWPKRRHHKNRILQAEFLHDLAKRSLRGARLMFRTDHTEYFTASLETIRPHPDWRLDPSVPWPFELTTVFQARAPSFQSWIALRT